MALYLIAPRNAAASTELDRRMRDSYDERSRLRLDLGVWILSATATVRQIADKLEIMGDAKPFSAIVFGLDGTYTGRAPNDVWNWLKIALERSADG